MGYKSKLKPQIINSLSNHKFKKNHMIFSIVIKQRNFYIIRIPMKFNINFNKES